MVGRKKGSKDAQGKTPKILIKRSGGNRNDDAPKPQAPAKKPAAREEKFNKGGKGGTAEPAKSSNDPPKGAKARACFLWTQDTVRLGPQKIRREFVESVKNYVPSGSIKACTDYNAYNRYNDVNCLDQTRVIIKSNYMTTGEDYIHASYVTISSDLVYICAQGPLDSTVGHFWLMVLQEKSKVVLQLCQFMEDGKEKCNEYYPPRVNEWSTYGVVQVRVIDKNTNVGGMKKVTKSKMQIRIKDTSEVHEITHIFFHGWPDNDVPESIGTVLEIRNLIHRTYEKKPIVAHCSAGIDRTGTFVLFDLVCYHLLIKHEHNLKTFELARQLRNQRMHALQNDLNYLFIFRCVLELLLVEGDVPPSAEITTFIEDYSETIKRKRKARKETKVKNMSSCQEKNQLCAIGPGFWNVRGKFKIFKIVDIETQMSIIDLKNGKYLVVDTVELDDGLKQEIDQLTNNGQNIEAVIATHPFHTLAFPDFYKAYPNASYYGTPRHLRKLTDIPWKGDLNDCETRKKWEPEVELRIPAGAEFVNPQPESSNHFISVFVHHPASRTLHVDDTIMYAEHPGILLRLIGSKHGSFAFHPSMKSGGLHPTPEAPFLFRDWMRNMLNDWKFENVCAAHMGVKIGGAHADVKTLLEKAEPLFSQLSKQNKKKNPEGKLPPGNHPNMNVHGNECG